MEYDTEVPETTEEAPETTEKPDLFASMRVVDVIGPAGGPNDIVLVAEGEDGGGPSPLGFTERLVVPVRAEIAHGLTKGDLVTLVITPS